MPLPLDSTAAAGQPPGLPQGVRCWVQLGRGGGRSWGRGQAQDAGGQEVERRLTSQQLGVTTHYNIKYFCFQIQIFFLELKIFFL